MQRLRDIAAGTIIVSLLAILVIQIVLAVQVASLSRTIKIRENARVDMLEARIIVLEKDVQRIKGRYDAETTGGTNERSGMQDNPER